MGMTSKGEGCNKNVFKNIRHKEYINVLFKKKVIRYQMKIILSILHRIGSYDVCKILLACFEEEKKDTY